MIRQVKQISDLPVAVITKGALLYLPEVQQDLMAADAVLPSLDAGNAALYKKINRPAAESWVQPADDEGLLRACAILCDKRS